MKKNHRNTKQKHFEKEVILMHEDQDDDEFHVMRCI